MTDTEATPENQTPSPTGGLVDLSDLRLMPAWVAGIGTSQPAKKYQDEESRPPRFGDRDRRGGPPGRRDDRGGFAGRGDRRDSGGGGGPRRDDRNRGPRRFDERDRDQGRPHREWVEVPKDIQATIEPEDKAVEALANHIRSSGHAFSMFDAARLVLAGGDRFHVRYNCAPERPTGLFALAGGGGAYLTRDEALHQVLQSSVLDEYYRVEEVEHEEPKGDFKSIGVCGFSGELLGPPSHHSFQNAVIRLHRERFSHMPLEDYKRRVRVDTNPELVAAWKEKQRKGHKWIYLKEEVAEGAEPTTFTNRADVEAHFRRTHGEDAVREVREVVLPGNIDKARLSPVLFILLRNAVDAARKHLFEMSQKLGGGFERRGLKLFKRRAGKLYVSRVKPRAVDPGVVFSARVATIVEQLKSTAGLMLHDLVEKIAPSPVAAAAVVQETPPPASAEGEATPKPHLSDDQISVIKDIRWLANEGYVIEYSDGMVFLGVQGEPAAAKAPAATDKAEKPAKEEPETEAPAVAEAEPTEAAEAEPAAEAAPAAEAEPVEVSAPHESEVSDSSDLSDNAESEQHQPEPPAQIEEPQHALETAKLSPPEAEDEEFALAEKRVEP